MKYQLYTTIAALALLCVPVVWAQNPVTDAAAKEPGAVVTSTGLVYRSLKDGTGASPTPVDKVKVHYRGTFPDGKEFDSSYKSAVPSQSPHCAPHSLTHWLFTYFVTKYNRAGPKACSA